MPCSGPLTSLLTVLQMSLSILCLVSSPLIGVGQTLALPRTQANERGCPRDEKLELASLSLSFLDLSVDVCMLIAFEEGYVESRAWI